MLDAFNWVTSNIDMIWWVIASAVTLAAALAAATPSPKDDSWVAQIRKVVDFIGLNFGYAKNAKLPEPPKRG